MGSARVGWSRNDGGMRSYNTQKNDQILGRAQGSRRREGEADHMKERSQEEDKTVVTQTGWEGRKERRSGGEEKGEHGFL